MILARRGAREAPCILCQWRSFSVSYRQFAVPDKPTTASNTDLKKTAQAGDIANKAKDGPLAHVPRGYGKKLESFTPTPLGRPIGMNTPPRAGENTGIDTRSLQQRRDDFVNYEKHLQRREFLKSQMARPYFRDWRNMQFHNGKTFLAPPRLFKADLSLYFPNLQGRTLAKSKPYAADTTSLLEGRASVVTIFSSMWAENQAATFTAADKNPALHAALQASGGRAQLVQVNVEEDTLKAWLIRLFMGSLRRRVGRDNWGRYFLVRRGITDEIRESIGLLNGKVGYTYLVDHHCRIRWAGSGDAEPEEREGLVKGVQRVLDEMHKEGVGENFVSRPAGEGIGVKKIAPSL
ncbi:ATP10 protein-domain-containing protein [Apodospora peruviana]|uniref:ATP10 protein-domain-containing protein n=1 Tax=Apodospora peruviana TaxID=516989 RepID=A0AAE0ISA7_9PEZI|nr:ATP10 protein-domain-containing protein [Apodospora peruviana]